jgi:hypothetical protein
MCAHCHILPGCDHEYWAVHAPFGHDEGLFAVGGKGASPAKLTRAGVPVSPGFHLTTYAYREFLSADGVSEAIRAAVDADSVNSEVIIAVFASCPLPPAIVEDIRTAYEGLSGHCGRPGHGVPQTQRHYPGLGEALVGGQVTPDTYVVTPNGPTRSVVNEKITMTVRTADGDRTGTGAGTGAPSKRAELRASHTRIERVASAAELSALWKSDVDSLVRVNCRTLDVGASARWAWRPIHGPREHAGVHADPAPDRRDVPAGLRASPVNFAGRPPGTW